MTEFGEWYDKNYEETLDRFLKVHKMEWELFIEDEWQEHISNIADYGK